MWLVIEMDCESVESYCQVLWIRSTGASLPSHHKALEDPPIITAAHLPHRTGREYDRSLYRARPVLARLVGSQATTLELGAEVRVIETRSMIR